MRAWRPLLRPCAQLLCRRPPAVRPALILWAGRCAACDSGRAPVAGRFYAVHSGERTGGGDAAAQNRPRDLRSHIVTVPNLLTVSRIVASPLLAYLVVQAHYPLALAIFVTAASTDLLDGYIARVWPSQRSPLGSVLDPAADKCLAAALFLSLAHAAYVPVPLAALVVSRDVGLVAYTMYKRYAMLEPPKTFKRYWDPTATSANIRPTLISKYNTAVQLSFCAAALCAAACGVAPDHAAIVAFAWLTAASTCASALSYLLAGDTVRLVGKAKRR